MLNIYTNAFCNYIESIIIPNDNIKFPRINDTDFTCFVSSKASNIKIREFIEGILKSKLICLESLDGIILYIVNLLNHIKTKGLYLNNLTAHRLIFILFVISSKIYDDEIYNNIVWARLVGLKIKDVNTMELNILKIFDFNLSITISPQKALSIYKCIY